MVENSFPFSTREKFHLWYSKITRSNLLFVFFFSILIVFLLVYFMAIDNILGWTLLQIQMYDIEGVLSGSTTVLPNGEIFALYTGNTNNFSQFQCKAVPVNISDPLRVEWVKYDGNPILYTPPGIGLKDHRNPSTIWKGPVGKHRMIMGSKQNKTGLVFVYRTDDFMNYKLLDEPLHSVPNTDMWEFVDFYPVSLTNDSALDMDGRDIVRIGIQLGPMMQYVTPQPMAELSGRGTERNRLSRSFHNNYYYKFSLMIRPIPYPK
ncbi:putative 2,1-fructan:2,1-fructan 1-fructosyltransferase [Helianthus annuus]|uniref:2,1-fructan:2,1-fructan 1-fructosyltransferase n=1 Tax=Helianthus annuus TaxID=4232 RepID=A0A251VQC8_HELAN|nr:putative 2,1-fructan:2,1-fructan 1-fructosyltransferase [Helianthus annuus]KAJ0627789.1 putative 2,1-fructan:2,1-fructan 1-fructosyltransferase [Helianthus annuus]KAJ0949065.1 putative 2,1-fructan:2,1-fructan 1-fructosyltransferase [Helianthus annuus]